MKKDAFRMYVRNASLFHFIAFVSVSVLKCDYSETRSMYLSISEFCTTAAFTYFFLMS